MSTFLWFAGFITVVYLIYYTATIMDDLNGRKSEGKENAEEIDLPTAEDEVVPDESPIVVVECDSGFRVGNETYETDVAADNKPQPPEQAPVEEVTNNAKQTSAAEEMTQTTEDRSEPIVVDWENPMFKDEYQMLIMKRDQERLGRPTIKVKKAYDEI